MSKPKGKEKSVVSEIDQESPTTVAQSEEEIAKRAYEIYLERGAEDGHALDDWLAAERELRERDPAQ